jgi:hypothetical protein
MSKVIVTVTFHKCIQDSQEFGSDDEHMVSRVFFTIEAEGNSYPDMYCELKQTVGSNFESEPNIEVGIPQTSQDTKYSGPLNYDKFRKEVEQYYRSCVGSSGIGIKFGTGAKKIRMGNNTYTNEVRVQFEASEQQAASW